MSEDEQWEIDEENDAASEAAHIGGEVGYDGVDAAHRAVSEGGGGESEGFELAEEELIDHASHGDQQSAHAILHHQGLPEEGEDAGAGDTADHEPSSERGAQD
ncbi:MAG TPA: hypothetical protein VGY13_00485 [Solirubrobacteraceae bacterium]|jgi:hypothetical protein|nr:hypothetical protein [Solirubrobacteraceae bacterium]